MDIQRMWINQPSTLQVLHHLHGTNVLAIEDAGDWLIYFLSGSVVSQQVERSSLSDGWRIDVSAGTMNNQYVRTIDLNSVA
jgi:hypothetical protein